MSALNNAGISDDFEVIVMCNNPILEVAENRSKIRPPLPRGSTSMRLSGSEGVRYCNPTPL